MVREYIVTFLGEIHHWDIIHSNSFWARNEVCLKPRGFKQNVQRQRWGPQEGEGEGGIYCSPGFRGEKGGTGWELPFESRFPAAGECAQVCAARRDARPPPALPRAPRRWVRQEKGQMSPCTCGHVCVWSRAGTRRVEMAPLENACTYTLFWKTRANPHCFSQQQK